MIDDTNHTKPIQRFRSAGLSVAEYAIAGVTVALTVALGLSMLGSNLNQGFAKVKQDMANRIQLAHMGQNYQAQLRSEYLANQGSNGSGSGSITAPAILDESSYLQAIQTTGGNGTTAILAQQIYALAQQLQQQGDITPGQANILIKLAEQGYRMAGMQKIIENAANAAGTNWSAYDNTQINFEGNTYSPADFAKQFAWTGTGSYNYDPTTSLSSLTEAGPEMQQFIQLYQTAANTGALNNPQAKTIITNLSSQILFTSDLVENASFWRDYQVADAPGASVSAHFQNIYNSETLIHNGQALNDLASNSTSKNSGNICQAGQGLSSSGQCQPGN